MRFEKPALTIEEQVELLLSRGMTGDAACIAELHAQFAESAKLDQAIKANLRGLGYGN